jgi:hypothetical protein
MLFATNISSNKYPQPGHALRHQHHRKRCRDGIMSTTKRWILQSNWCSKISGYLLCKKTWPPGPFGTWFLLSIGFWWFLFLFRLLISHSLDGDPSIAPRLQSDCCSGWCSSAGHAHLVDRLKVMYSHVFPQPRSFYKGKHRINHDKSIDLGIPMDTPFSEPMFDQILSSSRSQFSLGAKLHFPQVIGLVMIQAQLPHRMFLWHTGSHFGPRNIGIIWNNRCLTI